MQYNNVSKINYIEKHSFNKFEYIIKNISRCIIYVT